MEEHSKLLSALMRGMTLQEAEQQAQQITQAAAHRHRQQQQIVAGSSTAATNARTAAGAGNSGGQQRQQDDVDAEFLAELVNELDEPVVVAGSDSDYDAEQVRISLLRGCFFDVCYLTHFDAFRCLIYRLSQ